MERHRSVAINITFIVLVTIFLGVYLLLANPVVTSAQDPTAEPTVEPKYHFVMVSHIGPNDPNELWLTFAIAEFEKRFPEVKIDYVANRQLLIKLR